MNRDKAIELILRQLGNRQEDTELQAICVLEMQLAQEMVLEQADFKPWFLLSEFMSTNTGVGEPRVPLPTNFLAEHEEGLLWILPTGATIYERLNKDDDDTLQSYYLDTAASQPEGYSIVKNYIILHPAPDVAYPLRMRCHLKEPTLTYEYGDEANQTVITNAWLTYAADWLIGETGAVVAGQYVKDRETAQAFAQRAQAAKTRLYVDHVAREEMNRTRSHGDD